MAATPVTSDHKVTDVDEKHIPTDDVGAAVISGVSEDIDVTGPESRKILRKIDTHLMPLMCITYLLQVCYSFLPVYFFICLLCKDFDL